MNKHVVFISLPMSGVPDSVVQENIRKAKEYYLKKTRMSIHDVAFVDNTDHVIPPDGPLYKQGAYFVGLAILRMYKCDEVLFFPGWEKARGCRIEHEVCTEYDIPYMHMEEDDSDETNG